MKQVFVIAGPTGAGKSSILKELIARFPGRIELAVNATTRAMRPGEADGVDYHFMSNERFLAEEAEGAIPEHYHRAETDTYYGTYQPDIDARLARGKVVASQTQIVGAKYLKEKYGATTIFIMPASIGEFEKRVRSRSHVSDVEWAERLAHTRREIEEDAPWYDHRLANEEGKFTETLEKIIDTLKKEGYVLS